MMFDVQAETGLPMEYVEVSSVSVWPRVHNQQPLALGGHSAPPARPVSLTASGRTW